MSTRVGRWRGRRFVAGVLAGALVAASSPVARAGDAPPLPPLSPPSAVTLRPSPETRTGSAWSRYWRSRPPSPFRLSWALDLPLALIAIPAWPMSHYMVGQLDPPSCGQPGHPCDINRVPSFDRRFLYANESLKAPSDFLINYAPHILVATLFLDYGPFRIGSYLTDAVIMYESMAIAAVMTHIVRVSTRRPRPILYIEGASPGKENNPDATLSFWSGHVSYLFAIGVSASTITTLRHGVRSPLPWIMWTLTMGIGTASAVMRVGTGDHWMSDVLTGAAFGAGVGVLVTFAHPRREAPVRITTWRTRESSGVALVGRF